MVCARISPQPFCLVGPVSVACLALSSSGDWLLHCPPWRTWRPLRRTMFKPFWRHPRRPRFLGQLMASWLSAHGRALGLLHLRPHLVALAARFCSAIATARAFPSRAAPLLRPTALSLLLVTPALRPLALCSLGVQRPQHGAPLRLGRGPPLLAPQRTLLGREARSVELQAPPKRDSARGTSIGDACGGTASDRCGVRSSSSISAPPDVFLLC